MELLGGLLVGPLVELLVELLVGLLMELPVGLLVVMGVVMVPVTLPMGIYFPTGGPNCLTINITPVPVGNYLHTGRAPVGVRGI